MTQYEVRGTKIRDTAETEDNYFQLIGWLVSEIDELAKSGIMPRVTIREAVRAAATSIDRKLTEDMTRQGPGHTAGEVN